MSGGFRPASFATARQRATFGTFFGAMVSLAPYIRHCYSVSTDNGEITLIIRHDSFATIADYMTATIHNIESPERRLSIQRQCRQQ